MVTVNRYATQFECNTSDQTKFFILEFGLKTIPPLLFFILGTIRYYTIKDYGHGMTKYSNFFKAKVGISLMMGTFDVI